MLIIGEAEGIKEGEVYGNSIFCKPKIALKQILLTKKNSFMRTNG